MHVGVDLKVEGSQNCGYLPGCGRRTLSEDQAEGNYGIKMNPPKAWPSKIRYAHFARAVLARSAGRERSMGRKKQRRSY